MDDHTQVTMSVELGEFDPVKAAEVAAAMGNAAEIKANELGIRGIKMSYSSASFQEAEEQAETLIK